MKWFVWGGEGGGTVISAENKSKDRLKAHQVEEVPRQTRDPAHVKIARGDARLEHGFEADCQREG